MTPCESLLRRVASLSMFWPVVLVAVAGFAGCRENGFERVVVVGTVTYQGMPIEKGEVLFFPQGGAPASVAVVQQGAYRADAQGGVPVGDYRVEIRAYRLSATTASNGLTHASTGRQLLPSKYNTKTELALSVVSQSTELIRDFELN